MASELKRENPVFRSLEDKWRGALPFMTAELFAGLLVTGIFFLFIPVLFSAIFGGLTIAALIAWRKLDHDRSDYATAFLRRTLSRTTLGTRAYSPSEADVGHRPFEPR